MTGIARQLLARHGILTREALSSEASRGFSAIYPALKRWMTLAGSVEDISWLVSVQRSSPFRRPGSGAVVETAAGRAAERGPGRDRSCNPYGTSLPWPVPQLTRVVGATVVLVDGEMTAYLARGYRELTVHLPDEEPFRSRRGRAAAAELALHARGRALFITVINDSPASEHPYAAFLQDAGFARGGLGLHLPRPSGAPPDRPEDA
jgi:ATP-dependent Lhr-like helicase